MKEVIATTDGREHKYVRNHLIEMLGKHISSIVIERDSRRTLSLSYLKRISRRYNLLSITERIITKITRKFLLDIG